MVSLYSGETTGSDAAVWVQGKKGGSNSGVGIAQKSLDALRDIGVLDEIDKMPEGVIVYPNANISVSIGTGE
jgi:hypothetical protein